MFSRHPLASGAAQVVRLDQSIGRGFNDLPDPVPGAQLPVISLSQPMFGAPIDCHMWPLLKLILKHSTLQDSNLIPGRDATFG